MKKFLSPWGIICFIISAVIAVPMIFVIASIFGPSDDTWVHLQATILPGYIKNTLLLMLQVALYSSLIGVSTAWLVSTTEFPGRRLLSWALMLPLAAPAYIVAYTYTDLLAFSGPVQNNLRTLLDLKAGEYYFPQIRSLPGAALILSLVLYPYVYLLARTAFSQRSATLFNAARTLGAKPTKAFFRIALPAARPAIIGGLALILMETLADFGVVEFFGIPTFSTGIFRTWFAMGERLAAMKLAALMFLFVAVLVLLEKFSRKGEQHAHARDASTNLTVLHGWRSAAVACLCATPVLLGCLIPLGRLFYLSWQVGDPLLGEKFNGFIANSVSVASIAVAFTLAIALFLTFGQRIKPSRSTALSIRVATLGYALPGAMLAVGLLTPLSQFDRWLADFFNTQLGWQTGLILTGTVATLVYAYVVRFLTVAYNTSASGMENIPVIYDQTARSLGASPAQLIRRIHLPLLRRSIFSAAILVFVDAMRELPATLMLRPFNFETLATRVYRLASDERLAEASTAAITIVLIGLVPVFLLHILSEKRHR